MTRIREEEEFTNTTKQHKL